MPNGTPWKTAFSAGYEVYTSGTSSDLQQRWSAPEKEAFGVY